MMKEGYRHDSLEKCNDMWDWYITEAIDVPKPNFHMKCDCGNPDFVIRRLNYNDHGDGRKTHPYRCTVQYKCVVCSQLRQYGIVISPERYYKHFYGNGILYFYRDLVDYGIYG